MIREAKLQKKRYSIYKIIIFAKKSELWNLKTA